MSFTISWSLLKFMSTELVMLSNHLILCCPLYLLPSIFPSIRVFSSESTLIWKDPDACSNSCPSSWWCHPTILSSVVPFSCLLSFPASGSFPMSQLFASGGQSTRASASASVLLRNIQDWFPLGLTGLISLQFKGLSRVFFSTPIQKQQFFSTQPSLRSNSHICTWLLEKSQF